MQAEILQKMNKNINIIIFLVIKHILYKKKYLDVYK